MRKQICGFMIEPMFHHVIIERFVSFLIPFWCTSVYVETPNFSQTQRQRFGRSVVTEDCGWRRRRWCFLLVWCLSCAFSAVVWRWICGAVDIFVSGKMKCCRKWISSGKIWDYILISFIRPPPSLFKNHKPLLIVPRTYLNTHYCYVC